MYPEKINQIDFIPEVVKINLRYGGTKFSLVASSDGGSTVKVEKGNETEKRENTSNMGW